MVREHQRFALKEVTFDGAPVGGATVDAWLDESGTARWSARLLVPLQLAVGSGVLVGTTRDGRRLRGDAGLGDTRPGPRSARVVLVELHGRGPLEVEVDEADDPVEP